MTAHPHALASESGLADLARAVRAADRVVVLSDEGVSAAGVLDAYFERFGRTGTVELLPEGEPNVFGVDAATRRVRKKSPDMIVAVGGGSVIDAAKLVAVGLATDKSIAARLGVGAIFSRTARLIAVPTTAGSGSEMTRTAVVTDDSGTKRWAWGDQLRPDHAALIPDLTVAVPPGLTAASGLDALAHAIEAATASGGTASGPAIEAAHLISRALPAVMRAPDDLEARSTMQRAAALGGASIDVNGTGVAHAIAHALATVHGVSHGFAVGLGLHATIAWSLEAAGVRYAGVASALGASSIDGIPQRVAALLRAARFGELAQPHLPAQIDRTALAATITSEDNRPMCLNNSRPATPDVAEHLAHLTADAWQKWQAR